MVVHHISRNNHPENPVDPVGIGYWVLYLPRLPYEIPAEGGAHFIRVKVCDHYFTGVRDVGF
jgi:hypothetical protein